MSNDFGFGPSLTKLKSSLLTTTPTTTSSNKQEQRTCILTLLRILDNLLQDPTHKNSKLRKIKVTNATFWKRCGRFGGSVDYLIGCGFVGSGKRDVDDDDGDEGDDHDVPAQLKLEKEDPTKLLEGRKELIHFAIEILGIEKNSLPACPAAVAVAASKPTKEWIANELKEGEEQESGERRRSNSAKKEHISAPLAGQSKVISAKKHVPSEKNALDVSKQRSTADCSSSGAGSESNKKTSESLPNSGNMSLHQPKIVATEKSDASDVSKKSILMSKKSASSSANNNGLSSSLGNPPKKKLPDDAPKKQHLTAGKSTTNDHSRPNNVPKPTTATATTRQAPPKAASLSLEQIQMMARKEREETILEAKRLNQDRVSASANQREMEKAAASAVAAAKKQRKEEKQRQLASEAERERKVYQKKEEEHTLAKEEAAAKKSKGVDNGTTVSDVNTVTPDATTVQYPPSLSDEMTDLLDEIENELNDSFFNDDDDTAGDGEKAENTVVVSSSKKEEQTTVSPSGGATPVASLCEHENEDSVDVESSNNSHGKDSIAVMQQGREQHQQVMAPENESRVRLEQNHNIIDEGELFGDAAAETSDMNHINTNSSKNNGANDIDIIANISREESMHLPDTVQDLVKSTRSTCSSSGNLSDDDAENLNDSGHDKSASDLLDNLESETEILPVVDGHRTDADAYGTTKSAPTFKTVPLYHGHHTIADSDELVLQNRDIGVNDEQYDDKGAIATSNNDEPEETCMGNGSHDHDDELPASLAPDDGYSALFENIPLPEGEFSSSDNEDVMKFRYGFELCHRLFFSLWSSSSSSSNSKVNGGDASTGGTKSYLRGVQSPSSSSSNNCPSSATTAGLSNLKRWRQIWEDDNNEVSLDVEVVVDQLSSNRQPVVLVPLAFVYMAWATVLGLKFTNNDGNDESVSSPRRSKNTSKGTATRAGAQSGMMYSWVVSNHEQLATFDDVPISTESLLQDMHHRLPEASIAVCNYVCKALRDIGLISIYGADIDVMDDNKNGTMSSSSAAVRLSDEGLTFFVGMDSHVFGECTRKRGEDGIISLDGGLLRDCHGVLARAVYPSILDELADDNDNDDASTSKNNLAWYSCQHAIQHLLASGRLDEAKSLLYDIRFIRRRLLFMGLLGGTSAHCRDCVRMDVCLKSTVDEWRTKQLQAADIKRRETSSLDDYDNGNNRGSSAAAANGSSTHNHAPDMAAWREDHFNILCSISTVLREKAGELASSTADTPKYSSNRNESEQRRKVQRDIGDALQMIGECIGDIGVYRVQEMEHYEEALQLKSEACGEDQNHESIADILYIKGCHHQRFHHFKFAQKCYEQALRIYKVTLGYEHPCVARVLHNIGIMYHAKKDNGVALKCLKKSLSIRLSQFGETDLSVADSYCWIGKINREKRNFKKARECFQTAHRIKVAVLGKPHLESAEVLHNIGIVCDDLGLHSESLSCFREALLIRLANVSGAYDISGINDVCDTLDCIGNVYRIKGERQKALQFFEQCLKRRVRLVSAALSDKNQVSVLLRTYEDVIALTKLQVKECANKDEMSDKVGSLLVEMGTLYDHRLNKQSKALTYLQKALQVFQQQKDYKQIGVTLSLIGVIHVKKSANQKALKCFRDSLVMRKMSSDNNDTAGIAETMHNIGNCEAREGQFESSLRSYGEALRIKRKIFPKEHISIAKTEHCVGLAMLQIGNLDAALESFEASLKVRRTVLEDDHLDVSFSLHSLGKIYFHQNKVDSAIACLEEALEIKKSKLSEKHVSLAETRHLLGSLYIKKDNFTFALPLLKAALIAYRGSRDCEIMKSDVLDLLGLAYANLGENDHAILSYEHSLKIKQVVVPDGSPCANVLMEIGKLKSLKDDVDGALVAFKEVKRIQKIIYGKNHLKNADLLIQVGLIQDRLNNNEMALRCFEEALRMRRKLLDKNHRDIADALVHTGRMHQSKNDHFKSLGFFQDAIDIYRESENGDMSQECANVCRLLGLSQIASGDNENALTSLERCLEMRESIYGSESEQFAEAAYSLGIAQSEVGHYEDAVLLLDKFVLFQKSCEKSNSESLSNALLQLGKIYLKKRSIDNAMVYFDEALGIRKQMSDNELGVSEVLFQIGGVRESKKQYLEALVCYEESLKLRLSVSGEDEDTADIVSRIGEVRRVRGQYDLALDNFNLALDMYKSTVGEGHLSVANTYHSLGYVCDAKNDAQKAMQNHKEGLSVRKLMLGGDHVKVAASLDDVAGMYQKQNDHAKALRCLKEALRIRKLQLGNRDIEIGKTLFGMGIIFAAIGDNEKAAECYHASLDISSRVGTHPKLEAQTLHQIGCMHAAKCNYREALQNWRTCLSKYREGGLRDDHYMVACTLGNIEMAENVLNT